ncbi:beta-glucosidase [Catalinimonas alkaloidigena]|uniref:Periplasmic beta-glucosidase n=1 Tax=Catalinimonas alkaloidigena TaxID=1075417 RepID=A0A1G9AXL1_9BACT|nr:beta-glucosidase BglX [Catalinimonas alkaloidigena]SDK31928.1 beta-glucosidase [Catalinimonas alkaloidigena]
MKLRYFGLCLLWCAAAVAQAQNQKMDAYVTKLMKKMTLEEKIGQLNLVTPGGATLTGAVVSEGVDAKIRNGAVGGIFGIYGPADVRKAQEIAVKNSRLHIPLLFGLDVIHGHKTIVPIPLGLSCSWDTTLIERTARMAATEATADGLQWAFSPMVDISRDPRWGRISEGSGEDPFLGSKIAKAMVRGYQGTDLTNDHTLMACVKHFALYGAAEAGRDYNTVDMSRIKMYQYYLPPYKAAIDAGVGSIMSSFNEIDGVPATANQWLLTDLLRDQWGFDGLVVTDYTGINEMIAHGLGDLQEVSARALAAGVDMDMVGEGFLTTLQQSLKEGKITEQQIDAACRKVLEMKYKLGLFDDPYRYFDTKRPGREILTAEHRALAREAAAHSMVLLKNEDQLLPLKKSGTVALIGPLASDQKNMLGTWNIAGDWKEAVSIEQGIKDVAGDVTIRYAKGANITSDTMLLKRLAAFRDLVDVDPRSAEEMRREAVATARQADVVVAVLGEAQEMSGEAASRSEIGIPEVQRELLRELVATGKPVVLVVMSGRPLTLTWEDEHVPAIVEAWFGGTEVGHAVADVLFGDYNPSGKLTATFPRNVGQIPIYYNHKNTGRPFGGDPLTKFQSRYLDVSNEPLYPFGYGLSYTTFEYGDVKLSNTNPSGTTSVTATVTVRNTGKYAGEETVQLYLSDPVASVTRAVKELIGFQKVQLQPGQSKEVTFTLTPEHLKFYNSDLAYVWEPGAFGIHIGGNSRDVKSATLNWSK